MTPLEKEIAYNISVKWLFGSDGAGKMGQDDLDIVTKAAASVAKKYIEKAYKGAWNRTMQGHQKRPYNYQQEQFLNEWLKENGVI
jgi:hypothetical protein